MDGKSDSSARSPDSLSVKLGGWFEAHATGRGVVAVPLVVLVLALVVGMKLLLSA
jgi:hypothetical protein